MGCCELEMRECKNAYQKYRSRCEPTAASGVKVSSKRFPAGHSDESQNDGGGRILANEVLHRVFDEALVSSINKTF